MSASTPLRAYTAGAFARGGVPRTTSPRGRATRLVAGTTAAILSAGGLCVGAAATAIAATDPFNPNFGPNVTVFEPAGTDPTKIQAINTALRAAKDAGTHWSTQRKAFFFKPGSYGDAAYAGTVDAPTKIINSEVGYYTQVAGLGISPSLVTINGALSANGEQLDTLEVANPYYPGNAEFPNPSYTCNYYPWVSGCQDIGALNNFWRSLSNLTIAPKQFPYGADAARLHPEGTANAGQLRWGVSQAAPIRRVHVKGDLTLFPQWGGFASGGFASEIKVDGQVATGSQQQFFTRNSQLQANGGSFTDNGVWNTVFSGVTGAPTSTFPESSELNSGSDLAAQKKWTTINQTPISRDAPFLTWNATDGYGVYVPSAQTNSSGISWTATTAGPGTRLSLEDFYIAHPGDSAATINAALESGLHLLLTPGHYALNEPIVVRNAGTVVLGLGLATLEPTDGNSVIKVADVSSVKISGLLIDAGSLLTDNLVKIGPIDGHSADAGNAIDPTTLSDVFIRVGGINRVRTDTGIEVNSSNVILDDIWVWRADHGVDADVSVGYDWADNYAPNGVRINGDNVTALGLFAEHFQRNQVEWNGENGRTIFFQAEFPYEVEQQNQFVDGNRNGFAAYRVAPGVTKHRIDGAGAYSYFRKLSASPAPRAFTGFSVPRAQNVLVNHSVTRFLNGIGGVDHVVNNVGKSAYATPNNDFAKTSWLRTYDVNTSTDTQAPTVSLSANPSSPNFGSTYTVPVELTVTAQDNVTTAANITIEYRVDDRIWKRVPVNAAGVGTVYPPNGSHTVYFRATDEAGNTSALQSWTGTVDADNNPGDLTDPEPGTDPDIGGPLYPVDPDPSNPNASRDRIAPTVGISASPSLPNGTGGTYNTAVSLTITATDNRTVNPAREYRINGGSWTSYTSPVSLSASGTFSVEARATDEAGNISEVRSWNGVLALPGGPDTTKPTVAISSNPAAPGASGKYTSAVTVTATAHDDSGVLPTIQYRINNGTWSTYFQPIVFTSNGTYRVDVKATDGAGNVSDVKTWTGTILLSSSVIPTPPWNPGSNPPGTITVGPRLTAKIITSPAKPAKKRKWFKKAVTVRVTGTAPAGVKAVAQIKVGAGAWKLYTGPVKVSKTGKTEIQARVITQTSQSPYASRLLLIDRVKPKKIKVSVKINKKKRLAYVRFTATDKNSKVLKFRYKLPGKKWKTITAKKAKKGVKFAAKKASARKILRTLTTKKIQVVVYDKAANKSKKAKIKLSKANRKRINKVV
ncbi:chitobiase/beta-hexosaminidase C-terminal domain-containing protein [Rarobacter faecitabidus]|uniref:Ig-like protein group 3 n=1 Tax=Rarobacter faecitabidus TaxID=13243 RepID=A0A542ZE11_RARFA|nr:chitobiase/beta-hexosaminidase C-terminal domain-containing protein [Rarobacter faecitabidus]TQL58586.1 Ig-like protein group 3 [Rarobacter faecitabidus]